MATIGIFKRLQNHVPVVGNINYKDPLAFHATFGVIKTVNMVQMLIAEAYMNGIEIPDSALKALYFQTSDSWFGLVWELKTPKKWMRNQSSNLDKVKKNDASHAESKE